MSRQQEDQYQINEYIYKRMTPMDDKMERNKDFNPHKRMNIADEVARKIEEEPSDEELLQYAAREVHTDDAMFDDIFNLPADQLVKKPVLMIK